jgi:putative glutamine amidotransferase
MKVASWITERSQQRYFSRVFAAFRDLEIHNARLHPVDLGQMDALMLTGGGDISARFLKQEIAVPSMIVRTNETRDEWEFGAVREIIATGKPILAICRGLQVLNVALGGTLHLHVPNHLGHATDNVQVLRYSSAAAYRFEAVNSSHHQALDALGEGIEAEGWSATDGIIEQARVRGYPFAVGVQYHPERHTLYDPLFRDFFEKVRSSSRS